MTRNFPFLAVCALAVAAVVSKTEAPERPEPVLCCPSEARLLPDIMSSGDERKHVLGGFYNIRQEWLLVASSE